nr:hypothetical protein [Sphingomonas sp. HDW15A]
MDAVDRGRISLNDRVTLTRDDLTLFHQPIATKVLGEGTRRRLVRCSSKRSQRATIPRTTS